MYSYHLDFLKSFKRFVAGAFPNIKHYQFNYSDKAFLNYKLYQDHVHEYPLCIINLTDISTDDNKDFFRYVGNKYNPDTTQVVATNHTKQDSILIDFKWVTMQIQVKINLFSTADLLNYHNQLISAFPKNMMFYSYAYNALIHIDNYTKSWDVSDDTEGVTYRSNNQLIEAFSLYHIEPIFKLTNVTKNREVTDETSLDIGIEVRLKVPNTIGNKTIDNRILNGIQIVMNNQTIDKDLPILIDMNNDIYSDRAGKLKRSYLLYQSDFISETIAGVKHYFLQIPILNYNILNRPAAIFMVEDSTVSNRVSEFIEIPVVTESLIVDIPDVSNSANIIRYYKFEIPVNIDTFQFSNLNNIQLFVFE